jgi:hypothetical protein
MWVNVQLDHLSGKLNMFNSSLIYVVGYELMVKCAAIFDKLEISTYDCRWISAKRGYEVECFEVCSRIHQPNLAYYIQRHLNLWKIHLNIDDLWYILQKPQPS